ncbi:MAG TPA: hypothetical protein VG844_10140 [Terracidiphilus sp.]|nr:hypothetical protein [Terracidiphilus sp.]
MRTTAALLSLTLLITPAVLRAQVMNIAYTPAAYTGASDRAVNHNAVMSRPNPSPAGPFRRVAMGFGISPLGASIQLTSSLFPHLNMRTSANGFRYATSFTTNGFDSNAHLNLASIGASADIYPFHTGFRISPGLMILNRNRVTATSIAAGGTEITLNDQTFYSASANSVTGVTPLNAYGSLELNRHSPAFTLTTGWGNTIPHNGRHFSFPFEIGVAFVGHPKLKVSLSGWACADQAQIDCSDVASTTDSVAQEVQSDLNAQVARWENDLEPLKVYPILSFGVAYSFNIRGGRVR